MGVNEALRTYGAAIGALDVELDWALLGRAYCDGDGSDFFDAEMRDRVLETGFHFADEIGRAIVPGPGVSLYLGADVAELPIILAEHLVLARRVEWLNVASPATSELKRALLAVNGRLGLELPLPVLRTPRELEPRSCDHIWMVSVLTDPDVFPALHDHLYERTGGPLATGRGSLAGDRARATELVDEWLECAAPRCVLSTTDEELVVVGPRVAARGWTVAFAGEGQPSAVVGDMVRIGLLEAPRAQSTMS